MRIGCGKVGVRLPTLSVLACLRPEDDGKVAAGAVAHPWDGHVALAVLACGTQVAACAGEPSWQAERDAAWPASLGREIRAQAYSAGLSCLLTSSQSSTSPNDGSCLHTRFWASPSYWPVRGGCVGAAAGEAGHPVMCPSALWRWNIHGPRQTGRQQTGKAPHPAGRRSSGCGR